MEKKVFLKYLVVSWIPLSSLHIVLLRTLLGGLFLLGLFFLWGGRFTFHRKKKSFGFLELFGSAVLMIGGAMICELVKKKPAQ